MSNRSPAWRSTFLKAFAASFSIYLLPLYGPHAVLPLGEYLYVWLTLQGHHGHSTGWLVAQLAVAMMLQVAAGVVWYRCFAKPRWARILVVAACVPVVAILAKTMCFCALPYAFLVEQDRAPDFGN